MELIFQESDNENILQFNLFDGDEIIGLIQIRKKPTRNERMPEGFESHIYYGIEEGFRNRGYGTEILKLGILKAKDIGLNKLFITCSDDNKASRRIIEKNGGVLLESKLNKNGLIFHKFILEIN